MITIGKQPKHFSETMQNKLIFITGMHRSGTSALAKVFADAGFDAGSNLIPPDKDNPTGYWEDFDIFNLNNAILSRLFLTWDEVECLTHNWFLNRTPLSIIIELCMQDK